jgi:hypothetical protein
LSVSNFGLIVHCTGTATINGTINADFAGAGGGQLAQAPGYTVGVGLVTLSPVYGGWLGAGAMGKTYSPSIYLGGSGAPSSYAEIDATGVSSSFSATAGGSGGGLIGIRAQGIITVAAAGVLTAKGQNGGGYPSATGVASMVGLNGGSGGTVILHSDAGVVMQGTILVTGGNGNNPGCAGVGCNRGLAGGNGGGGGTVVLQAPSVSNTGTVTLTGGTGGPGINGAGIGVQLGAPIGSSNGGAGGISNPVGGSVNGNPGGVGVILSSGSPL